MTDICEFHFQLSPNYIINYQNTHILLYHLEILCSDKHAIFYLNKLCTLGDICINVSVKLAISLSIDLLFVIINFIFYFIHVKTKSYITNQISISLELVRNYWTVTYLTINLWYQLPIKFTYFINYAILLLYTFFIK